MRFYLGTHQPSWLSTATVPLMASHRRLGQYKRLPRAAATWALDSGGYTELSLFGTWQTRPRGYVTAVARYTSEIGNLAWAAQQDWMCEPRVLARIGLTVAAHQRRTLDNYLQLRDLAADLPFMPVLQGAVPEDYQRAADAFEHAGIALASLPIVGVGTLCRRTGLAEIHNVLAPLRARGLHLHAFGVKTRALTAVAHLLDSADSMAWSLRGRYLPGCTPTHSSEANCRAYALAWHAAVLRDLPDADTGNRDRRPA